MDGEIVALRDPTEQLEAYGIADEKVEVVNQRGEVGFVHLCEPPNKERE